MVVVDNPCPPPSSGCCPRSWASGAGPRRPDPGHLRPAGQTTQEGRLQVELAQYQYLLPRLLGMWTTWSARRAPSAPAAPARPSWRPTGGTSAARSKLREELEQVRRVRATQRTRRGEERGAGGGHRGLYQRGQVHPAQPADRGGHPANNRLFDTLDTTTRTLEITDTCTVLLSDTVGFIRKLPHHLVEAFKATLEELELRRPAPPRHRRLQPLWREQAAVVEQLIVELGAEQTPRIDVFNKCDNLHRRHPSPRADIVSISAKTGQGLDALLKNRRPPGHRRLPGGAPPALRPGRRGGHAPPAGQGGAGGLQGGHRGGGGVYPRPAGAPEGLYRVGLDAPKEPWED